MAVGETGLTVRFTEAQRAKLAAVALGQEIQATTGEKYIVTVAGTTAASPPAAPAVSATVADGTATLLRQK